MKKFGTPIGAAPGAANENVGFDTVGTPLAAYGGGGPRGPDCDPPPPWPWLELPWLELPWLELPDELPCVPAPGACEPPRPVGV
jgi:hypothetical protein